MGKGIALNMLNHQILPGESRWLHFNIARLPSHTKIDIPAFVSRSDKPGPVLLLMGGLHGDEINGMEIVRRMLDSGYHKPEVGTTICIPVVNIFGFINFSREVPDGKDVNRSFPGIKAGSLASRVAYMVMQEIIPHIDYGIDFHTGGASRTNFPQIRCVLGDPLNDELARAFQAPFTLHAAYRSKSLRQQAARSGKRIIVYEGGESLRFNEHAIQMGVDGALRVMKHLGMRQEAPAASFKSIIIRSTSWLRAKNAGLFHSFVESGQAVKRNQLLGQITDAFGEFQTPIKAASAGYVIGLNHKPVVHQGDALLHLGITKGEIKDSGSD